MEFKLDQSEEGISTWYVEILLIRALCKPISQNVMENAV